MKKEDILKLYIYVAIVALSNYFLILFLVIYWGTNEEKKMEVGE